MDDVQSTCGRKTCTGAIAARGISVDCKPHGAVNFDNEGNQQSKDLARVLGADVETEHSRSCRKPARLHYGSGFQFHRLRSHTPESMARHMSSRYCWSLLKLSTPWNSDSQSRCIGVKRAMGRFSHVPSCFPIGPE